MIVNWKIILITREQMQVKVNTLWLMLNNNIKKIIIMKRIYGYMVYLVQEKIDLFNNMLLNLI